MDGTVFGICMKHSFHYDKDTGWFFLFAKPWTIYIRLNSFNETRYLMEYYEGKDLGLLIKNLNDKWIKKLGLENFEYRWIDELSYLIPARLGADQPLQCHSDDFSSLNYGAMVYKKTAAVFGFMRRYLGDERFDKAMQTYFNDWKFKHPSPRDLQKSMEMSSGEDLSWFFEGWIKTDEKNDWLKSYLSF